MKNAVFSDMMSLCSSRRIEGMQRLCYQSDKNRRVRNKVRSISSHRAAVASY
jgi:hypothetical protein